MKVLTYNIHGYVGLDDAVDIPRLARVIQATGADIVGLNEVYHPFVPPGSERPALDSLVDALGMHYAFGAAVQQGREPGAAYGNALLSRYAIKRQQAHLLPAVEGKEQRGALEVDLRVAVDQLLRVFVTHLDHTDETARLTQLEGLLTATHNASAHLILGDFNALAPEDTEALSNLPPHSRGAHIVHPGPMVIPRMREAGCQDAFAVAGEDSGETFSALEPIVRIDYIWISPDFAYALRKVRVWSSPETRVASDHLPLLAEFD